MSPPVSTILERGIAASYAEMRSKGHSFSPVLTTMQGATWRDGLRRLARKDGAHIRTGWVDAREGDGGRVWGYDVDYLARQEKAMEEYDVARGSGDEGRLNTATEHLRELGMQTPEEIMERLNDVMRGVRHVDD